MRRDPLSVAIKSLRRRAWPRRKPEEKEMSQPKVIPPSNGRIVLFRPGEGFAGVWHDRTQLLAASICHVWGDRMVNLDVIDSNGVHWPETSVTLVQPGDALYDGQARYCRWMPYQVGQAAKTEEAERTHALPAEIMLATLLELELIVEKGGSPFIDGANLIRNTLDRVGRRPR